MQGLLAFQACDLLHTFNTDHWRIWHSLILLCTCVLSLMCYHDTRLAKPLPLAVDLLWGRCVSTWTLKRTQTQRWWWTFQQSCSAPSWPIQWVKERKGWCPTSSHNTLSKVVVLNITTQTTYFVRPLCLFKSHNLIYSHSTRYHIGWVQFNWSSSRGSGLHSVITQ